MRRAQATIPLLLLLLAVPATVRAETASTTVAFEANTWIPLNLTAEGVRAVEMRFDASGGVEWKPWRAGKGPQVKVAVKNTSARESDFSMAIALFDDEGRLVGATEIGHPGDLDPGESTEVKLTFKSVRSRVHAATKAAVVIENRY